MCNDKRKKRIFIIEIEIQENAWDYKKGELLIIPIISNSFRNADESFCNKHWGSEYPFYIVQRIIDTFDYGFFKPNIKTETLL